MESLGDSLKSAYRSCVSFDLVGLRLGFTYDPICLLPSRRMHTCVLSDAGQAQ
jgi:hypothetical protein